MWNLHLEPQKDIFPFQKFWSKSIIFLNGALEWPWLRKSFRIPLCRVNKYIFIHRCSELKHKNKNDWATAVLLFYWKSLSDVTVDIQYFIEWHNLTHIYCCTYYIFSLSKADFLSDHICKHIPINILQIFVSVKIHCRKLIPLGYYSSKELLLRSVAGIHCHLSGVSASALMLWLIASGLAGEKIGS